MNRLIRRVFRSASSSFTLASLLLGQLFVSALPALAQSPPGATGQTGLRANEISQNNNCDYRSLELTLFSDIKAKVHLDREAEARLYDKARKAESWKASTEESEIVFCVDVGDFDLDISAVGYLTDHRSIRVDGTLYNIKLPIVLQKDPEAVDLDATGASALPPRVRSDVKSGTAALKNSNLKEAQKKLERAYQGAPSNEQVNFLLGYLFLLQKDYEKSEQYLNRAVTADPRNLQSLTLLGRVQLQRDHVADAQKTLQQAVDVNSGYWMAHNLLADAYLRQKDYDKARQQAQLALEQGKTAASAAQLILGQALAYSGKDEEGIRALQDFLQANPNHPTAPQVKDLIVKIKAHDDAAKQQATNLALEASTPTLPPSAWGPPGVDEVKPTVANGMPCPYDQVIEMSGERVKQFVDSITQFAATEDMVHEQLDPKGNPITKETRKFNYVASITETRPGYLAVDEYRDLHYGMSDLPDRIVTTGFASLALVFHPAMRDNFSIMCEGLGDWHGQATWIMHFQQREDKPNRIADLVVGGETYPVNLKGRAWITADTFQIVRIESELMNHIPLLAVQHQIAEYGPIHFQKGNIDLWLPKSVDLYFELNKHRYYRRHSFDHYMLFAVNSEEKAGSVPGAKNQSKATPPSSRQPDTSPAEGLRESEGAASSPVKHPN